MPTAVIDLAALRHNLAQLRQVLQPGTAVMAMVKADAYGHGAGPVALALMRCGVTWFGVATPAEALALRAAGVSGGILVLMPAYRDAAALLEQEIALTITDEPSLAALREQRRPGQRARVHLEVDTGMGRLGLPPAGAVRLAEQLARTPDVILEGLFTHFACADEADRSFTDGQLARFQQTLSELERRGIIVPLTHAANSAGMLAYPEAHFDLVRPGIALYGYHPSPVTKPLLPGLKPVMTLSAPVVFVKRIKSGQSISYGATWRASSDTTIATVRLGYADGYPRALSNRAQVRLHGAFCPVVGRVCMDQLMVEAGALEANIGDRVTLFGPEGPTAEELAQLAGTIPYELLTRIGGRVERSYVE
jgi:alanine racemase